MRRFGVLFWVAGVFSAYVFSPSAVGAAERQLVMFSSKGCVYCQVFNREVGKNYRWSKVARKAPLRKVDLNRDGTDGYSLKRAITVTPTFVLFRRGREVSRFYGYPGKKNFYHLVRRMLKR